jgi:CRISPR/Cas system-associated endonuclease/helicase Cas3
MMCLQAATDYAQDKLSTGAEANVLIVRMMGVRLITATMPSDTRKALMAAVKEGRLGRLKKDGLRPEAFYHPNAKGEAISQRDRAFRRAVDAIAKVCGNNPAMR